MNKCIAIAIILLGLTTTADAGIFRRNIGCGGTCSTCYTPCVQEVVVPVLAYPLLVPAYQFQYVPPAVAPVAAVVPVTGYPVATPVVQPVAPVSYGQPNMVYGQQPQQNFSLNNKDKIKELARALLEEMNRAADGTAGDNGPPAVPGTQPFSTPAPQPFQPQPQLQQFALSAMTRTCAQCHTGIGSKRDFIIFTQPGYFNQNVNWKKVKDEVSSGRMPPKDVHFQLTLQERQTIVQWLTSIGVN